MGSYSATYWDFKEEIERLYLADSRINSVTLSLNDGAVPLELWFKSDPPPSTDQRDRIGESLIDGRTFEHGQTIYSLLAMMCESMRGNNHVNRIHASLGTPKNIERLTFNSEPGFCQDQISRRGTIEHLI